MVSSRVPQARGHYCSVRAGKRSAKEGFGLSDFKRFVLAAYERLELETERIFSRSGWAAFASKPISFPATWDRPWFQSHLPWAKQAIHPHHPITPAPPIEVVGLALGHQGPLWKRSGLQCWGCLSGGGAKASQEPAKLLACHQGRRTRLLAAREVAGPAHATRPVRRFASHSARGCCAAHR